MAKSLWIKVSAINVNVIGLKQKRVKREAFGPNTACSLVSFGQKTRHSNTLSSATLQIQKRLKALKMNQYQIQILVWESKNVRRTEVVSADNSEIKIYHWVARWLSG